MDLNANEADKKEGSKLENESEKRMLSTRAELVAFAYEVGAAIAIPLVIFALGGRFIDRAYGTGSTFLIIGLLLSLISTGYIIYKKVKKFM